VIETGWVGDELPVSAHLRTVAEILNQPPLPEERRALRREAAEAEAGRAQAQDFADSVAARGLWIGLMAGPAVVRLMCWPRPGVTRSGTLRRLPAGGPLSMR
jgi:hypothetical protein